MPSVENLPDILIELNDVAKAAGIRLDSISPAAPTTGNGMQIVPINLQFSGDYYSITDLLYRLRALVAVRHGQLEATGRLFSVKSISLAPSGTSASTLGAAVSIETYIYGSGTVLAPAAPVTPPATTDATATTDTTASASAEGAP
jgi:Tfp pilus assembly protein PilO